MTSAILATVAAVALASSLTSAGLVVALLSYVRKSEKAEAAAAGLRSARDVAERNLAFERESVALLKTQIAEQADRAYIEVKEIVDHGTDADVDRAIRRELSEPLPGYQPGVGTLATSLQSPGATSPVNAGAKLRK